MTTITDKLEGLLPADGSLTTKDERVIAEAVRELRDTAEQLGYVRAAYMDLLGDSPIMPRQLQPVWPRLVTIAALAFATGCIASAIFVVLV